jgi:hypothetical protein
MKNQLISFTLLFLLFSFQSYSQGKPNSIYFEALGNGGFYSINYDRMFKESFGGKVGFSYLSKIDFIFTSIKDLLVIPVMLNYFIGTIWRYKFWF